MDSVDKAIVEHADMSWSDFATKVLPPHLIRRFGFDAWGNLPRMLSSRQIFVSAIYRRYEKAISLSRVFILGVQFQTQQKTP